MTLDVIIIHAFSDGLSITLTLWRQCPGDLTMTQHRRSGRGVLTSSGCALANHIALLVALPGLNWPSESLLAFEPPVSMFREQR